MTCTKCGRSVPPGEPWCDACRGPVEFSEKDVERMKVDVRSRILWADPVETIREEWLKKGAPAGLLASTLEAAVRERHRHFRVRGIQDVLIAVGAFVAAAFVIWVYLDGYRSGRLFVLMAGLPCVGLIFGMRGLHRLSSGGKDEKQASDLSEFD